MSHELRPREGAQPVLDPLEPGLVAHLVLRIGLVPRDHLSHGHRPYRGDVGNKTAEEAGTLQPPGHMRLTIGAEYALKTMFHLSRPPLRPVSFEEIAERQAIPKASLRRLLRWLTAKDILRFQRGRGGGYVLRRPRGLTLREVLEAVEGPLFENDCLVHGAPCPRGSRHWCPMHEVWEAATGAFLKALESQSVADLGARVDRWQQVDSVLAQALARAAVDQPPTRHGGY